MTTNPVPPSVVIAGFGLPGRFVAELLECEGIPFSVVELNADVVERTHEGLRVVRGDVRDEAVLRSAGIEHARLLVLTVPDDRIIVDATTAARRINPSIQVLARCNYTSVGMRAGKCGAEHVVVVEQLIAREMHRVAEGLVRSLGLRAGAPSTVSDQRPRSAGL